MNTVVCSPQTEMPFALVQGQPLTAMPEDLYIPPDALEVILEAFEGPLDLLLYLIKRQNLDILNIPIAEITKQYMEYVDLMKGLRLDLAAEYLVMAATLAEIKSRLLLPRQDTTEEDEADPRAELVRRLQEYERFKQAAEDLDALPRQGREVFLGKVEPPELEKQRPLPQVDFKELMLAFQEVLNRAAVNASHAIAREQLSVRERMTTVLGKLQGKEFLSFQNLFTPEEGRMGVVVTFIALLELMKQAMIELIQAEPFSVIHVKCVG